MLLPPLSYRLHSGHHTEFRNSLKADAAKNIVVDVRVVVI